MRPTRRDCWFWLTGAMVLAGDVLPVMCVRVGQTAMANSIAMKHKAERDVCRFCDAACWRWPSTPAGSVVMCSDCVGKMAKAAAPRARRLQELAASLSIVGVR